MTRPRVPNHRNRHQADRPRAGDEYIFAQHRERKRRVHSVAEGIEDGRHLAVDAMVVPPDIGHGQRDQFGKGPCAVHPHTLRRSAEMPPSGQAVAAAPADHMPLATDDIAGEKVVDIRPDCDDLAHKLMPHRHGHWNRLLRPLIPLVDVNIGAADPRFLHAHQYIVDAHLRLWNLFQPQAPLRLALDQRLHCEPPIPPALRLFRSRILHAGPIPSRHSLPPGSAAGRWN